MSFVAIMRLTGASLVALAIFHAFLWRSLDWGDEIKRLSRMTSIVFAVHTFFIAFVLCALGLLSLLRPELLLIPSDLGCLLLVGVVAFWFCRLLLQPLVFDHVMRSTWAGSRLIRGGACALWAGYVAVYGGALLVQLGHEPATWIAPFDFGRPATWVRVGIACVWVLFGLVFKALDAMPRHRRIVARVVGERASAPLTLTVALGEITIGAWMLSGRGLALCVGAQTLLLVTMNALEIRYARDLLVSPVGMVCANIGLLSAGWYVAFAA